MANNTIYNIINECTGDSDCDPAGVIGTFQSKEEAIKSMKEDAQDFYDEAAGDDEEWKKDHPLIITDDEVKFDYDGVEHHWYIDESTVQSKDKDTDKDKDKDKDNSIVDEMMEHIDVDSLDDNFDDRLDVLLDDLAGDQAYDLEADYELDTGKKPDLTYEQEEELKQAIRQKLIDHLKEMYKGADNA